MFFMGNYKLFRFFEKKLKNFSLKCMQFKNLLCKKNLKLRDVFL